MRSRRFHPGLMTLTGLNRVEPSMHGELCRIREDAEPDESWGSGRNGPSHIGPHKLSLPSFNHVLSH
jgi:hypothetical protein